MLNILDVVLLVNLILDGLNPSDYQLIACDLNEDRILNIVDIVQMVNFILE